MEPVILPSSTPEPESTPTPAPATTSAEQKPGEKSAVQKIAETLKAPEQRKLLILDEILRSKNDNDPRLDSEFRNLTPELKAAFTKYYQTIPPEGRNERGTIAFLYARSLSKPEDVAFLTTILHEPPCRSLSDCSKDEPPPTGEAAHLEGINETTANYPQLTALRQEYEQYRRALGENPPNEALANALVAQWRGNRNAQNPKVREESALILKSLKLDR